MPTRKFLLITYHFPPSAAVAVHRMLGLVRYLPRFGWEPIVIAPPRVAEEPEDHALLEQVPAGTAVIHVPLSEGLLGKAASFVLPMSHWLPKAWRACQAAVEQYRPEAVYTSSPPGCVHFLGSWLRSRYGLPWLACLRDPWITARFVGFRPFERRLGLLGEARMMRQAQAVLANSPNVRLALQREYPRWADKVLVVTNGFDADQLGPLDTPRAPGPELRLLHAGEVYAGRDPRPLLDALGRVQAIPGAPRVRTCFLGRTTDGDFDLATEVRQRGLEGVVELRGQVPHSEALQEIRAADMLLVLMKPGARVTVPAKVYEYLGIGRPILGLIEADSDAAWVLRESQILHRLAPPDNETAISDALLDLARAVRTGAPIIPEPEALARFTREHMARLVARHLDAAIGVRPARVEAAAS